MKAILFAAIVALAIITQTACDQNQVQAQPKPQPVPQPVKVVHHFEPAPNTRGLIAIDTATGQACKTFDWHNTNTLPLCSEHRGGGACLVAPSPYENAPLCSSLQTAEQP